MEFERSFIHQIFSRLHLYTHFGLVDNTLNRYASMRLCIYRQLATANIYGKVRWTLLPYVFCCTVRYIYIAGSLKVVYKACMNSIECRSLNMNGKLYCLLSEFIYMDYGYVMLRTPSRILRSVQEIHIRRTRGRGSTFVGLTLVCCCYPSSARSTVDWSTSWWEDRKKVAHTFSVGKKTFSQKYILISPEQISQSEFRQIPFFKK